jgi:hypothetical protein
MEEGMTKDTITTGGVEIPRVEYLELCKKANQAKIEEFGEDIRPVRDYAFQIGYIRGARCELTETK